MAAALHDDAFAAHASDPGVTYGYKEVVFEQPVAKLYSKAGPKSERSEIFRIGEHLWQVIFDRDTRSASFYVACADRTKVRYTKDPSRIVTHFRFDVLRADGTTAASSPLYSTFGTPLPQPPQRPRTRPTSPCRALPRVTMRHDHAMA